MRIEKVVINSSPLIVLFKTGQSDLLPLLFERIVVPEQVFTEVTDGNGDDSAQKDLPLVEWIIREQVDIPLSIAAWNLGRRTKKRTHKMFKKIAKTRKPLMVLHCKA